MKFIDLFESDFTKPVLKENDGEECHVCNGTGEGRTEHENCSHCGGSGMEPSDRDNDDYDMYDTDDDYDRGGDDESHYEKYVRTRGLEEQGRLPYPVRSEKLGMANFELLKRAIQQPTGPRLTLSFGDRVIDLDREDLETLGEYYDNELRTRDSRLNFIRIVMSDPDNLNDVLRKLGRRTSSLQPDLFQEDKKKDNETDPQVRDVRLQRAITRAKADFPTAGSGIEALAKDFMRSQDQDQKSFDQLRAAERQQSQLLQQINKLDQEQSQEINNLEQENSELAQRLEQLQSVNSQLEKKLAAMSGRKIEPKAEPSKTGAATALTPPEPSAAEPKSAEPQAIEPRPISLGIKKKFKPVRQKIQRVQPQASANITPQLTTQNPDVLEPIGGRRRGSLAQRTDAEDGGIIDVEPKVFGNIAQQLTKEPGNETDAISPDAQAAYDDLLTNITAKTTTETKKKPEPAEADYGDEYQSMVKRVGQLAKQGPRKTIYDPVKRVYKTVPVNK